MSSEVKQAGPEAAEIRRKEIVTLHAKGHDALDRYGISRMVRLDGQERLHEYTIAERIGLLAELGGVPAQPKASGGIV